MRATNSSSCEHLALFYRDEEDYVGGVLPFLADGVARDAAVLVAVPPQRRALLERHMDGLRDHLSFVNMADLGRNPGRIIPGVRQFAEAHAPRPLAFVGEPVWPGRTIAETRAVTSHEALLNLAFAGTPGAILCPYDAVGLAAEVLADAEVTHPLLLEVGLRRPSARFVPPSTVHGPVPPLPPPPSWAECLPYGAGRLVALRRFVRRHARAAGLGGRRTHDALLAVTEVATNSVRHGGGGGTLWVWTEPAADGSSGQDGGELVCELRDAGHIQDPLAGRYLPSDDAENGRGLWLVHQLCDLVEMRSDRSGTITRLHLRALAPVQVAAR